MKQRIFTLLMLLALVFVAGSAKALNDISVYQGGTYTYELSGVGSTLAANATVTIDETNTVISQTGTSWAIAAASSGNTVGFTVKYADVAGTSFPATGPAIITVSVSDGSCSNSIELDVTINAAPMLVIQISGKTGGGCQLKGTPDNNVDAVANGGPHSNAISFTVAQESGVDLADVESFSYTLNIAESTGSGVGNLIVAGDEGDKVKTALAAHNISFNTAEGGGSTVTATILTGGTFKMNAANGGATYTITVGTTGTDNVVISPMPSIGSF